MNWKDSEYVYESHIATNINLDNLRKLKSSRGYSDCQLEDLTRAFDAAQKRFGVVQLIYNAAQYVGHFVKNTLTKQNQPTQKPRD